MARPDITHIQFIGHGKRNNSDTYIFDRILSWRGAAAAITSCKFLTNAGGAVLTGSWFRWRYVS
jgi:hypothetical protein